MYIIPIFNFIIITIIIIIIISSSSSSSNSSILILWKCLCSILTHNLTIIIILHEQEKGSQHDHCIMLMTDIMQSLLNFEQKHIIFEFWSSQLCFKSEFFQAFPSIESNRPLFDIRSSGFCTLHSAKCTL